MTRQEAMKRLNDIRKEKANSISAKTDELDKTEGIFKDIDALDMALAFLSTSYCNWVSINDFLPKNNKPVLIYGYREIQIGKYNKSSVPKWDYCSSGVIKYPRVTHWMPLPEPPICENNEYTVDQVDYSEKISKPPCATCKHYGSIVPCNNCHNRSNYTPAPPR